MVAVGRLTADDFVARNMQLITKLVADATTATLNVPVAPTVTCPECKTGTLRKRAGKNGSIWRCSKWQAEPPCAAKDDDFRGQPKLNPKPKAGFAKKGFAKKAAPGKS